MGNIMYRSSGSSLIIVLLCILLHLAASSEPELDRAFLKAEIQSCSGCALNRLPDVKSFIFEDVPKYEDVTFKHISGALPELVLYSENFKEEERLSLKDLTREECNSLLKEKGFHLKNQNPDKEL